jgi:nucleoside-diphosphate-sugar epimerase
VKILLTGDAGFIGGRTALALSALGHVVRGMDKKDGKSTANFELLENTVAGFRPEMILHLGASCSTRISLEKPLMDFEDNAVGTMNVAEVSRKHGNIPILYTSTVKVEPGADGLLAPLGLSKVMGEEYLRLYRANYGVPSVILRPSTVYGPGQRGDRNLGWVGYFIRCAVEGAQAVLQGSGEQSRDVLYIDDFVKLLVDISGHFDDYEGKTLDVGGGPENELSINQLIRHLGVSYNRQPALPSDLERVVTDNGPLTAIRGWKPTTDWQTGVRKTREAMTRP